jgi:hypothetical protein
MNPYASFLGELDARTVIATTSAKLAEQAARLGPEGLKRQPAPGKWNATQILCHFADCEMVFAFRLRQSLAEDYHVIQPFDQDAWAKPYAGTDARLALELFDVTRRWNLALLETVAPADFAKKLTHPERGEMTFQTVLETMAGHDLNHLGQLERLS